jgi:hypothetical protein
MLEHCSKCQIWQVLFYVILLWHLFNVLSDEQLYHTASVLEKRSCFLLFKSLEFVAKISA